jgi:hypothetical protein
MKMEYAELKGFFSDFHAEKITKTELIAAIGLFQEMNQIPIPSKGGIFIPYLNSKNKISCLMKYTYIPRNISPRIIGFRHDYDEMYEKGFKEFVKGIIV